MLPKNINKIALELLAPAKNIECGIAAIDHGADAVYIGAEKFGARKLAGNSLEDISKLVKYAHFFNARIYVAINTLLFDNELEEVEKLIWQIYNTGADAIIIQDMGILQMKLPPIQIHASTQTDNRTPAKVKFLQDAGFSQVVLARELSIKEIKEIRKQTSVALEYFVHGALCVCYSGKCYMGQATTGRSANRGECNQPCRLPYSLVTKEGKTIIKDQHLLSLKDLNLSDKLQDLVDAGITSFKIEGRLKDANYVKNITAHYRHSLDKIIDHSDIYTRSSSGRCFPTFTPSPEKSFARGFSTYFLDGRQKGIWSMHTPKSLGEKIGKVISVKNDHFNIENGVKINNGDGLCFLNRGMQLRGFRVNVAENSKIFADNISELYSGATIFRNHDQVYEKELEGSANTRKIEVNLEFSEYNDGVTLHLTDEDGCASLNQTTINKEPALKPEKAMEQIKNQLLKWGGTPFRPNSIQINLEHPLFIPVSVINAMRRDITESHNITRESNYKREVNEIVPTFHKYPEQVNDYSTNILNNLAIKFYEQHGVEKIIPGFEIQIPQGKNKLMTTRHCIRYATNNCPKENPAANSESLILKTANAEFMVEFDCKKCEMHIVSVFAVAKQH